MVVEEVFLVRRRVVSVVSYISQVWFFLRFGWWLPIFVVRTGWGVVADSFDGLHNLSFSSGTICTYVGTGHYFGYSHK